MKRLVKNNLKVKYFALLLTCIFFSALFETLFNLKYNFGPRISYDYVSIPTYYFFGNMNRVFTYDLLDDYQIIASILGALSIISAYVFYINRKVSIKVETFIKKATLNLYLETFIIIIIMLIWLRFIIWKETYRFHDNPLIFMDVLILLTIYTVTRFISLNKGIIKDKIFSIKIIYKLLIRYNSRSLNRKLATLFILGLLLQISTLFYVFRYHLYWTSTSTGLYYSIVMSIPTLGMFSYVYYFLYRKFKYMHIICEDIKHIEQGNLKYKLNIKGHDEVANLASSINNITSGLEVALENQIKSEKMKTELITNVSHDLKTPLTSIVNYVDILKNNELDRDTIKDYINILDRKSKRLKTLVEDIFEASKISSGDIELNIEKTDIKELLIQSIVELDDKIKDSNLDFVIDIPDEAVYTLIDGKRMFRIFENLINNIIKYSLKNTRVYIDLINDGDNITIILKNISNHKLNMKSHELLERFRRGDVSRNTEGSGLGLSIAQNLVSIQDGSLDLIIDGDLFKVVLKFKSI